jgi:hypothetical protein
MLMPDIAGWLRHALPAFAAAFLLAGCGSSDQPGAAAAPGKPKPASVRKVLPGSEISPDMVGAVSGARTGAATVQLKFELLERPSVGEPLEMDLAILPAANIDRIYGRIEASDGLALAEGAQIAPTDRAIEGMPIRHSVKLKPGKDGIFTLTVVVSMETGGQTSTQAFSIPVIVGAGIPDVPAPAPKPAAASR